MGAWIEMVNGLLSTLGMNVAPHVGAWIEINLGSFAGYALSVAPHVGAWIEINGVGNVVDLLRSHPTWVRGLKYIP